MVADEASFPTTIFFRALPLLLSSVLGDNGNAQQNVIPSSSHTAQSPTNLLRDFSKVLTTFTFKQAGF